MVVLDSFQKPFCGVSPELESDVVIAHIYTRLPIPYYQNTPVAGPVANPVAFGRSTPTAVQGHGSTVASFASSVCSMLVVAAGGGGACVGITEVGIQTTDHDARYSWN